MKILLLGDYSNVHATLADGLRTLGHEVTVASDGDGWKNYPRDVDFARISYGRFSSLLYYMRARRKVFSLKGYDVVQLINPVFLPLKAERLYAFYNHVRRSNGKVFMGAFGMDYYWVKAGLDCHTFRYSDFNLGSQQRHSEENDVWINDWLNGEKGRLNRYVARDCEGIVAGLYEYWASYQAEYGEKLQFIPFPIVVPKAVGLDSRVPDKVRFFIGIQRSRSSYKGTDVMLRALLRVERGFPDQVEVRRVENVPFNEYRRLMLGSDVILDQLYSYTPAMNALEAMAQGLVVVGGGEPENYDILGEETLRPIVNVLPDEESVYHSLRNLVLHKERIPQLKSDGLEYIRKHHDHVKVAQQYLDFWTSK